MNRDAKKKNRGWNEGLTSGTMKLIAILRRGGCLGLRVGEEEFLPEVLETLNGAAARKVKLG